MVWSDGLTVIVGDYEVKKIVSKNERIEDAVRALIDQANENGGKDNISAILIQPVLGKE